MPLSMDSLFCFVFLAKRPGNQDRSPCPSRWFLIYGLTFWKHWFFVVCVWLSAPRSKQCLEGLLTVDLAFVYLSYEISLHVLLPMTIQLSMSGQPSHPMKSLTSHKAPCRYELAHSRQFLVGEQLCKAQLICHVLVLSNASSFLEWWFSVLVK